MELMNVLIVILFMLVPMMALSGCIQEEPYESVSADLKIEAMKDTCGMSYRAWGEKVTIDSSGNGLYETVGFWTLFVDGYRESKSFRLTEEELFSLSNSIEESGFFELEGNDSGFCGIWDYCTTMNITKNGSSKAFRNEGCDIKPYTDTEELIWIITKEKT